jgi:hypothetical protein
MSGLETFDIASWDSLICEGSQERAVKALENGQVLYFPNLPFILNQQELLLLNPSIVDPKAKNISYNKSKDVVNGSTCQGDQAESLRSLLKRYSETTISFLDHLIPHYKATLKHGRTSLRPVEIAGRKVSSYRKDDTLLHVDSFPSTPTRGERILRVFTNVDPAGRSRVWRLGEPFADVVQNMAPKVLPPVPGVSRMMQWLGITKEYRTLYDHYMLSMHNMMKGDSHYQATVPQEEVHFPSGSSWVVFTDQTSHAAMAGQHVLEQTLYLPIEGQWNESLSPLRQLESYLDKSLV